MRVPHACRRSRRPPRPHAAARGACTGTGTFGRVRLVEADTLRKHLAARQPEPMSHATNCFLALKRMKKSEVVRLKQVEHILNEKSVLAETSHPFIVDMYHTFQAR